MNSSPPPFDPSKPFTVEGAPPFDPSKPFTVEGGAPKSPSFGERLGDIGQHVLRAGEKTLEETGFMPPLHVPTVQEYKQAHPDRGSVLGNILEAGKSALADTARLSGLALGPMAMGARPVAPPTAMPAPPLPASGISVERAALAKEARDVFGIPVTGPQVGMSGAGKLAESMSRSLPLSGARAFEMTQRRAFNRAVSKTFGEDSPVITQQVMDAAKRRIGGVMDRIEKSNDVLVSGGTIGKLSTIESDALQSVTTEEYKVVRKQIDNVLDKIDASGNIPGQAYGALLRKNGPLDKAMSNTNSNISRPASQIADTLREALQNSLTGADLDAYRLARFQYKNMKTIEPLAKKAPTGDISPTSLNERVSRQFPNRAYDVSGRNHLDRLAKIGQAFLKEPPTSGTAERSATLAEMGKIGGAVAAGDIFGGAHAVAGAGGALAANRVLSAYLRSQGLAEKTIAKALAAGVPPISHLPGSLQALRALPGSIFGQFDQSDTMRRAAQPVPQQP